MPRLWISFCSSSCWLLGFGSSGIQNFSSNALSSLKAHSLYDSSTGKPHGKRYIAYYYRLAAREKRSIAFGFLKSHMINPSATVGHVTCPNRGKVITIVQMAHGWNDHDCSFKNFPAWTISLKRPEVTYCQLCFERGQRCFDKILSW